MFSGIIEETAKVVSLEKHQSNIDITLTCSFVSELKIDQSVAHNGVCLTVCACDATRFTADVLGETERRTGLAGLLPGARVNLERAMKAGDRFGGHVVQGHVDGRGTVAAKIAKGRDFALRISYPRAIAAATVLKGSIAVNGVSLTVSGLGDDWLQVDVIPTTAAETNLGLVKVGEAVNLESDVLGKYAIRRAETVDEDAARPASGGLTLEKLAENGFL